MKSIYKKSFVLNPEVCDEISQLIMDFCANIGTERKDAVMYRLSAEECMLYWMDHGCTGNRITLNMGKHMLTPFIEIEAEGDPLNPYSEDNEDFGSFTDTILSSLKLGPDYNYENDANRIRFRVILYWGQSPSFRASYQPHPNDDSVS